MRLRTVIAVALAACAALPSAALAAGDPPIYDPDTPPPGANDFSCRPTAAHPQPLVLVHGLGATAEANWYDFSPKLAAAGYCVFALTYGRTTTNPYPFDLNGGTMRMEDSVHELSAFIDKVLAATGAPQVDIVGHSEGSLLPDYYVKSLPDARYGADSPYAGELKVARYVAMTPLWQGTNLAEAGTLSDAGQPTGVPDLLKTLVAQGCASCPEFIAGSDFIKQMNADGGPRVPGVTYTTIMTRNDELVQPYTSGYMEGATNIVLQDQCPADPSEHVAEAVDPLVYQDVLNALDPAHAKPVDCTTALQFG